MSVPVQHQDLNFQYNIFFVFLCVLRVEVRGDCSCCCYWWNYCPSLLTISFLHCEFSIYLNYINASIHVRIVCLAKMNKKHTMFTVNFDAANTIQLSLLCTSISQLQYFTFHNACCVHVHVHASY